MVRVMRRQLHITTTPSGRSQYSPYVCGLCSVVVTSNSNLEKHMKRHASPYGCVIDGCVERFRSLAAWKLHERTAHPEQEACYRCNGSHKRSDGSSCFGVFYEAYHWRAGYLQHLEQSRVDSPVQTIKQADANHLPRDNQGKFWCGFCDRIVDIKGGSGAPTWEKRFTHIHRHLDDGWKVASWVEFCGNGYMKGAIWPATVSSESVFEDRSIGNRAGEDEYEIALIAQRHNDELQHTRSRNSQVTPLKNEDEEMIEFDPAPSSQLHAKLSEENLKFEQDVKYYSVEVSSMDGRDWLEPRYSMERLFSNGNRATDEPLLPETMRRSDEPANLYQPRHTDELRDATSKGV